MGIFSGLFRSRDAPQNRTSGSAYSFFLGNSTSGKRVNERSAMQMTAVYSCVRILSEAVAGLPLHFYRYTDNGGKEKAVEHPLYFLLHDEPNPEMTSFVFKETLMTHTLAGIGVSLGLSMNFEAVTARYVDVRLERKKEVLDAYHGAVKQADPAKADKAEPKKAKSAAKKKSSDLEL